MIEYVDVLRPSSIEPDAVKSTEVALELLTVAGGSDSAKNGTVISGQTI